VLLWSLWTETCIYGEKKRTSMSTLTFLVMVYLQMRDAVTSGRQEDVPVQPVSVAAVLGVMEAALQSAAEGRRVHIRPAGHVSDVL
jgi:hypothetical protein